MSIQSDGQGTCQLCNQVKRLTKQGKLWPHNTANGRCGGTGLLAVERL